MIDKSPGSAPFSESGLFCFPGVRTEPPLKEISFRRTVKAKGVIVKMQLALIIDAVCNINIITA